MISNAQKSLIHVAKSKTGMTEDEYRAMLSGFGVASSTDLDRRKFEAVMRHFKKMGFQSNRAKPSVRSRKSGTEAAPEAEPSVTSEQRLKKKIQAMASEMHLTRTYLDAIAKRMTGVDTWIWLDADQLRKLVAVLVYHQKRQAKAVKA